jgi:MFS transporter, OFA family, oxalate/formate antiporter
MVALAGVSLWGAGSILAGLGTAHFGAGWLYLTYGVLGGFGVGMAYVTPVAVVTKWFPDRRGLGSGMVVMGFGLGACLYTFAAGSIPRFEAAAVAAAQYAMEASVKANTATLAPHHVQAVMDVFVGSGIVFLVVGILGACFLRNPPIGASLSASEVHQADGCSFTTVEMLRTLQFHLLWLMLFVNVTAGILVIANAVPIMQELTNSPPGIVAAAFGAVAMANALGSPLLGRRIRPHWAQVDLYSDLRHPDDRVLHDHWHDILGGRDAGLRHCPALLRRRVRNDALLQR